MDNAISKTVVIIDSNITNGIYLSSFCKSLMPDSKIIWLLVCEKEPTLQMEVEVTYYAEQDLASAARRIDEEVGECRDIIVFYNLQLGMLQRSEDIAVDSQITYALKKLVDKPNRRILINVHSTDMPTRKIAEFIDPRFKTDPSRSSVISHHLIAGASPKTIKSIVRETLYEWEKRFLSADYEE